MDDSAPNGWKLLKRILLGVLVLSLVAIACLWMLAIKYYKGVTPLGHGYCYMYADDGVVVSLDMQAPRAVERVKKKIERAEDPAELHGGSTQLGPDVDRYRVYDRVIVGHVKLNEEAGPAYLYPKGTKETPGYFIIDTDTDRMFNGLSKGEWLKRLRHFGVTTEPRLRRPSIFDKY